MKKLLILSLTCNFFLTPIMAMQQNNESSTSAKAIKQALLRNILNDHRITNMVDATFFVIAAKVISKYIIKNNIPFLLSAGYGITSWLSGELAETIYKEIYKKLTKKTLRQTLGRVNILGLKIDCQGLLRRIITMIFLIALLHFKPV